MCIRDRYRALDAQYAKEQDALEIEIAELEKAVTGYEPVSYTHLDVYKRQLPPLPRRSSPPRPVTLPAQKKRKLSTSICPRCV